MVNNIILLIVVLLNTLLISACSDNEDAPEKDHVWKEQTETLDKAKEIEAIIQNSADQQKQQIEEESQ